MPVRAKNASAIRGSDVRDPRTIQATMFGVKQRSKIQGNVAGTTLISSIDHRVVL